MLHGTAIAHIVSAQDCIAMDSTALQSTFNVQSAPSEQSSGFSQSCSLNGRVCKVLYSKESVKAVRQN